MTRIFRKTTVNITNMVNGYIKSGGTLKELAFRILTAGLSFSSDIAKKILDTYVNKRWPSMYDQILSNRRYDLSSDVWKIEGMCYYLSDNILNASVDNFWRMFLAYEEMEERKVCLSKAKTL